jgi:hypothetical protein
LLEWSICQPVWQDLSKKDLGDHYWSVVTNQIILRNFIIIKEWYDQLNIKELHCIENN